MSLVDLVLELHDHLHSTGVPHAFGGALALAYIAEPRGTVDVDINVFTAVDGLDQTLAEFATLGFHPELDRSAWLPIAGIRLRRPADPFPVDVFPPLDAECYDEIARRCVEQPFGTEARVLPFLSAEDLVVFKLSFGRDKDWVDLRNISRARPDLDADYVERQLLALRGPSMHPRLARLRRLLREAHDR